MPGLIRDRVDPDEGEQIQEKTPLIRTKGEKLPRLNVPGLIRDRVDPDEGEQIGKTGARPTGKNDR